MCMLGPIGFTAPWLLVGLVGAAGAVAAAARGAAGADPAAVPRRRPAARPDATTSTRPTDALVAAAAADAGGGGGDPRLRRAGPEPRPRRPGSGPLLILADGTWADARDWPRRLDRIDAALDRGAARRAHRGGGDADRPAGGRAAVPGRRGLAGPAARPAPRALGARRPRRLPPGPRAWATAASTRCWLSDGLARPGRAELLAALQAHGTVRVFESPRAGAGAAPRRLRRGAITLTARRSRSAGATQEITVAARGPGPNGVETELAAVDAAASRPRPTRRTPACRCRRNCATASPGSRSTASARPAAVSLTDDALKRRKVALIAGREDREGLELLSPTHYLDQALEPDRRSDRRHARRYAAGQSRCRSSWPMWRRLPTARAGPLLEWVQEGRAAGPLRRAAAGGLGRRRATARIR